MIGGRQWFGMIAAVSLRLLFLVFRQVLGLILPLGGLINEYETAA